MQCRRSPPTPTVLDLNGKLQSLVLDVSRLKGKYKEAHPEVQKVQLQIDLLRKAKATRIQQIEDGLRAEFRQLERREAELKGAIESQKGQAVDQSRKLTELDSLKKQADSATGLYTVLLQKLNETNIAASLQNNNVRLLDRAIAPTSPVWPDRNKLSLVGLLLGLVLGAAYVLLRDYFGNAIKDAEDVERFLHIDLLAAVPKQIKENAPLATEAYQTLRTALLFARKSDRGQILLVSGTAPGEGKTTTVVNLAKLLAVSGESTVVVDCDLRRANLHNRLSVAREPGLTDFFVTQTDLKDLIQPTKIKNLFVLTAGPLPPNPPAILARENVADLLEQLRAALPLGHRGLAAPGLGDRRPSPRPPRRHDRARGPARQGGQEGDQAEPGRAAQGHGQRAGSGPERRGRQDPGPLLLLLPARQGSGPPEGQGRPEGSSSHGGPRCDLVS